MVEAPGTAPGSETLMSRGVYRHSRLPDAPYIGASFGFLKASRGVDASRAFPRFSHGPPSLTPIKSGANKDRSDDAPLKRPAG